MSNLQSKLEQRKQKMAGLQKSSSYEKVDYWYPQKDKQGNGSATIRFIPHQDEENGIDCVTFHRHEWQNQKNSKYFIEYCPTDKGRDCPVCEANKPYYEGMTKEEARKAVGHRTRKKHFVANVLVIKDPANPANEGKVRLFKFGVTILRMLEDKMSPKFADEVAGNPWDLEEGINFKLKVHSEDKQIKYTKSGWEEPSDVTDLVDYKDFTELASFVADDKYKTYEELEKHFCKVEGISATAANRGRENDDDDDAPASTPEAKAPAKAPRAMKMSGSAGGDDEEDAPKVPKKESKSEAPKAADDDEDDELEAMMRELSGKKKEE